MYISYERKNIQWLVKDSLSDVLKEMLDSLDKNKNCEIIRDGENRKVLKYTHNHRSFYIKQYSTKNGLKAIKSLFSLSKAQKEWNQSQLLFKKQLHTAELVALGEKRHFGMLKNCYIISKAIPNSTTVRDLLIEIEQSAEPYKQFKKNTLLNNLISYLKKMHDSGISHGELHAENILVNQNDITLFYLIDLGRTKFKRKLSVSSRIQEIARLSYSLIPICTNEEIAELANNYASQVVRLKEKNSFIEKFFRKLYKIQRRIWYGRAYKSLKNNLVFKVTKHNRYTINVKNEWDINVLQAMIHQHDLQVEKGGSNIIKTSSKTNITCIPSPGKITQSVYIKEYRYPTFMKKLRHYLFGSPARKAWFAAHGLMALDFQTPKPVALLEERNFCRIKRSFIIMEDLSACLVSNKYLSEKYRNLSDKVTSQRKRMFISCLATSFRQLHDSNIYHGDLKAENILIMELSNGWNFYYLDLDRVFFYKKITLRRRIKNLSQLNASMPNCITYTDRLRFYRTYTGMRRLTKENKQILQTIIHLSIQRYDSWIPKYKIQRPQSS